VLPPPSASGGEASQSKSPVACLHAPEPTSTPPPAVLTSERVDRFFTFTWARLAPSLATLPGSCTLFRSHPRTRFTIRTPARRRH